MNQLIKPQTRPIANTKTRELALALLLASSISMASMASTALAQQPDIGRSPEKATRLSLLTTVGSAALGGGLLWIGEATDNDNLTAPGFVIGYLGVAIGPSVGRSYAGKPGRGVLGAGIRLVTGAASAMFIALDTFGDPDYAYLADPTPVDNTQRDRSHFSRDLGIFLAGVTVFSAVYDIAVAARSAREFNTEQEKELARRKSPNSSFLLGPTYFAESEAPGLLLAWNF